MSAAAAETVRIVPYEDRHRAALSVLVVDIQRGEFGLNASAGDQPDLVDPAGFFREAGGEIWVALTGGPPMDEVVGAVAILDFGERRAALRKMFVRADMRGRPHRIAERLLETLIAWARERDFTEIYLDTLAAFAAARRFYARHGFEELTKADMPADFPAMNWNARFFRRRLQAVDT
ncbi:MAG TPA: GNAT family N-acetyltransferase [Alphaproteobacteria bacterium]|nr:GNAT family N-acetyltransferase [Alphaproteobacteria bacterium]